MTKEDKKRKLQELTVEQFNIASKLKDAITIEEILILINDIRMAEFQKQVITSQPTPKFDKGS